MIGEGPSRPGPPRPTAVELGVMAMGIVASLLTIGLIWWRVRTEGLVWSGSVGGLFDDSMQYLTWIKESSDHVLAANLFTLDPPTRVFAHPGIMVSALLHKLGLSVPLSYAVWIPIAAGSLCAGAFAVVSSVVEAGWARTVALTIAIFYAVPAFIANAIPGTSDVIAGLVAGDVRTLAAVSSGYPYSAMGIALACFSLVGYSRLRAGGRRFSPLLCLGVLLVAWLQPWLGATVIITFGACEVLVRWTGLSRVAPGGRRGWSLAAAAAAMGLVPIIYYWWIGRTDPSWIASERNLDLIAGVQRWWLVLLLLAPLAIPALLAARVPTVTVADLVTRAWPAVAVAQAIALSVSGLANSPSHALRGVAIPLSALAVIGISRATARTPGSVRGGLAMVGVVVLAGLGSWSAVREQERTVNGEGLVSVVAGYFVPKDHQRAIDWVAGSSIPGGVFGGRDEIAAMVPLKTGRQVWMGHGSWSPNAPGRAAAAALVVAGRPCCQNPLIGMDTGRFVRATGARFLILSCGIPPGPAIARLGSDAEEVHRFGCATVIVVRAGTTRSDREAVNRFYGISRPES